jgi:tetratricopeptide (TPR) repeat protein
MAATARPGLPEALTPSRDAVPRLTLLQWLLVAAFLAFYGFAVFALTRDYYLRHPPRVAAGPPAGQAPHALPPQGNRTFIQQEVLSDTGSSAPPKGDDPRQLNRVGDELFAQKRYAEAIPYYRRALALAPHDPDASNDLGLALHYTGQAGEAVDVLRTGAERSPDFQRIWLTLGFVSANTGDAAAAREALEKAEAMDPENAIGQEAARLLGLLEGG